MNTTTYIRGCIPLVFNISSFGFWENLESPDVIFGYALPLMEIQILIIFLFIIMIHIFLKGIGISPIPSYMLAGMLLGPQLFNLREISSRKLSWDPALDGNAPLKGIQVCGNIMLAFLMSVKTSRRLAFNNGPLPIVIGVLCFFAPFIGGLCVRNFHMSNIDPNYLTPKKVLFERTVIITSQASILLPTITYFLSELKILNSELGRLVLSASLVNDIFGSILIILAYLRGTYKNISPKAAYRDGIAVILLILIVFFVLRPIVEGIVERTPEGKPVADVYVHAAVITVIASAAYSAIFNMKYLLGPFLVGLIIPEGPPIGSALEAKYEALTLHVLIPISITFSTMRVDLMKVIYQYDDIMYNIFLMVFTGVLKFMAAMVPCLYCKVPLKEAIAASLLLCTKSFSEIFIYESTYDDTYISLATYTFLILCALVNSGIIPTALCGLYDPNRKYVGYQKRNIMNLKPNSDLRILTCLHKPENISAAISFLQLMPSTIMVTVLHLVKLVGKIAPVMISHNKKSKQLVNNSYIHTANVAFSQLESVAMNMFTAVTHENLMHDEICKLALEQAASMIIVPSGRKWSIDGAFESEDEAIRRVNESLIKNAPCSIGILVDRGQFSCRGTRRYHLNVGIIFIGGKDDREALSLVKKLKHNPRVKVTVIRLISNRETESTNWEYILDHEVLEDLTYTEATNCIAYTERIVTGGPEVATANVAFSQLESVAMNMFTAVTHENLMHDEICKLALEQAASMIIVPSGRKWSIDGAFESEDEAIRRVNESLIKNAPCSIGILVDRGQFSCRGTRRYHLNVGIIFIGGKDDREALSLVKKLKHNPRVKVTVIRLISNRETESTNWEYILDHEVLEDLTYTEATNCIAYTERIVTGGPEVATTVRKLSEDYDLMVLGRDHGMATPDFDGLKEWIELPELGVIGDLLAARDLNSRVSVLVVQQQLQT